VLENEVSKRSTIIGTPHWMPPELVSHLGSNFQNVRYGTEMDCWAYGCAVYEMATGTPPNARVRPGDLGLVLHREQPRLQGDKYSQGLKDFIVFVLEVRPEKRPTTAQINDHQYIKDTDLQFPTNEVCRLLEYYARWESSGGERSSLFNPFGAQAPDMEPDTPSDVDSNDWNFSTTLEFDKRLSMGLNPFEKSKGSKDLSPFEKVYEEARIKRGGAAMQAIFNTNDPPYDSDGGKMASDLPLRNLENSPATSRDRTTLIDLDAVIPNFDDGPNLDLDSVPTIRARRFLQQLDDDEAEPPSSHQYSKRATQDWKFPYADENTNRRTQDWKFPTMTVTDSEGADVPPNANGQTSRRVGRESDIRNRHTQDWKFPTAEEFEALAPQPRVSRLTAHSLSSSPDRSSMIDLDDALPLHVSIPEIPRPPTADSATDSAATDMTSGDPFDLEPQIEMVQSNNRGSLHMKSQSEPTAGFQTSKQLEDDGDIGSDAGSAHNRSSSMNRSEIDRAGTSNRGSTQPRYRNMDPHYGVRSGYDSYEGSPGPWDPFSDNEEEMLLQEERRGGGSMDNQRATRRNRRANASSNTGAARAPRGASDEGGALASTLRPPRASVQPPQTSSSASMPHARGPLPELREPPQPNTAVLMHNVDPDVRGREMAKMWDELAYQAEFLRELMIRYMLDDEEEQNDAQEA
jgi:protein-serine/threonine kinase